MMPEPELTQYTNGANSFVPETKGRTLEELDKVFEVSTKEHALYGIEQALYFIKRFILRRESATKPLLICDREVFNEGYGSREDVRGFPDEGSTENIGVRGFPETE